MTRFRVLLCSFLIVALAHPAAAQEQTGSIQGVVKDAQGGVLPGVSVEARSAGNVGARLAVTDTAGVFRFPALPPGSYEFTATLASFSPARSSAVVALGKLLKVDFTLKIGSMTESVQVTGEAPLIDSKANAATATVSKEIIDMIPKGRGLLSVLTQIPGTNNESRSAGLMIDGASGAENRFLVDGVDRTNARTGLATAITGTEIVVQDFIETVQVKQSGYNAEFRAALGGVVNAITKSGTNKFSGSAGVYYTDNKWLGAIRPTLRSVLTDGSKAEYIRPARTESGQTDFVFSLGGPIIKDKVWFFAGFAPQYYPAERTVKWQTPGVNPPVQTFTNANSKGDPDNIPWNYNVSAQPTSKLRVRFTGNNETQNGALALPTIEEDGTSRSNASTFNPRSAVFTEQFSNSYSGIVDYVANSKTYLNLTAGYINYGSHSAGGDYYHGTRRTFSNTNAGAVGTSLGIPASFQQVNGFADNLSNSFTVKDDFSRLNASLDITRFAQWKGDHAIKIGGMYERIGNFVATGQQHANIAFVWDSTYATTSNQDVRGKYGYFIADRNYVGGDIKETNLSLFVQDQWTVNNKLTINYGVRLENEEIPSYNPPNPGVKFGWGDKIGPRVGFAYDLKGDNKWKVYGSYGQFYDTMKLSMPRGSWGGDKWVRNYYTLDTFDWKSIDCKTINGEGCTGGTLIERVNFRETANDGSNPGRIDPNIRPSEKHEVTLGLDRELSSDMSLGLRYAHKAWDETIDDIGIPTPAGTQNFNEIYNVGNPGRGDSVFTFGKSIPPVPAVVNEYDGFEIVVRKRYSNNWQATSSILFSRAYGNYSGLASSDEEGRANPNVSRYYDIIYLSYDEKGKETLGLFGTDRPVQFKFQGSYTTPWHTNIGVNFQASSGLLMSSTVSYQGVPVYYKGRGDLGRTPMLNQTDLVLTHDVKIKGTTKVTLMANIFNVFDQDTATHLVQGAYRDALTIAGFTNRAADAWFQPGGINVDALQAARNAASSTTGRPSPQYKKADAFQGARSIRVMAKISF